MAVSIGDTLKGASNAGLEKIVIFDQYLGNDTR